MKRWILLALIVVLSAMMLIGCGGGGAQATDPAEVKGETYDAGNVSALVPTGWKAFPATDLFDEYDGDNNPNTLYIYKGAKNEFDMFSCPGITINYYEDATSFMSAKSFYDDAADIDPVELGAYTWNGYTATSVDYPYTILEGTDGEAAIQVSILMENGDKKISLEDVDVQAIIASIAVG